MNKYTFAPEAAGSAAVSSHPFMGALLFQELILKPPGFLLVLWIAGHALIWHSSIPCSFTRLINHTQTLPEKRKGICSPLHAQAQLPRVTAALARARERWLNPRTKKSLAWKNNCKRNSCLKSRNTMTWIKDIVLDCEVVLFSTSWAAFAGGQSPSL